MSTYGRVTLPIQEGMDDQVREVLTRLGADAVRNSDGTYLPDLVHELGVKVYSTYFPARGDQPFALAHPETRTHFYALSERATAPASGPLALRVVDGYLELQVVPDTECDTARWWQVIDRTTGEELPAGRWTLAGTGTDAVVTIANPEPFHVYTVAFLAWQQWDSTQMYNYITNDWHLDPARVREIGYDARHPLAWEHMQRSLGQWLQDHPEVDVVRFTTFFYHFTLMFGRDGTEKFVDWFGYTASVSPAALEAFEAEYGARVTAEDFVDGGYYNSPFREPTAVFRAYQDFMSRFVAERAGTLVAQVHEAGREAMMFLGDNWIGTEPYGPHFPSIGLDAVVGSVGSAATCRMISDIPGVTYREGRFLPYFFPDVFNPDGDPVGEANESWLAARRAIVRSPLDRIGYGGYLSLALEHPDFMDRVEAICDEFREIHEKSGGERPANAPFRVGVVNAWGALRTWQTHMVAHALPYRHTEPYIGVLETRAGLPFEVDFLSFDDVRDGVPEGVGVLINAGGAGTAYSGGSAWADAGLQRAIREFVAGGGGFIGVGEPTATPSGGAVFQLSDVLGVDREIGWSLSTDRYPVRESGHFILPGEVGDDARWGTARPDVVAVTEGARVLADDGGAVRAAVNSFGAGRGVYLAGLPWSVANSRLLHRAIFWAAGREDELTDLGLAEDPRVEVAVYPQAGWVLVTNISTEPVATRLKHPWGGLQVDLEPRGFKWLPMRAETTEQTETTTEPSGDVVSLEYIHRLPDGDGMTTVAEVVADWNAANPGIQVTSTKWDGAAAELIVKLETDVRAGEAACLAQAGYAEVPNLYTKGMLEDVTQYASQYTGNFSEGTMGMMTVGETVVGLPQDTGPLVYYYDQAAFAELGIELPTTSDEFLAAAETAAAAGKYIIDFQPDEAAYWLSALAASAGATWYSVENDAWKVEANGAETQVMATFLQSLLDADAALTNNRWDDSFGEALINGELIGHIGAAWEAPLLADTMAEAPSAGNWQVAQLPDFGAGQMSGPDGGSGVVVLSGCPHPEEALAFANWFNTQIDPLVSQGLVVAATTGAMKTPDALAEFYGGQDVFAELSTANANMNPDFPYIPTFPAIMDAMKTAASAAADGSGTVAAIFEAAQTASVSALTDAGLPVAE